MTAARYDTAGTEASFESLHKEATSGPLRVHEVGYGLM